MIYLYVKQHSITGLKYFGMTRKEPHSYVGSGKYWLRHLRVHGKEHVQTLEVWQFATQEECTQFALNFSQANDIVESSEWANLRVENGVDGNPVGLKQSPEWIANNILSRVGKKRPRQAELMKGNQHNLGKKYPHLSEWRSSIQTGKKRGPYKKKHITNN